MKSFFLILMMLIILVVVVGGGGLLFYLAKTSEMTRAEKTPPASSPANPNP